MSVGSPESLFFYLAILCVAIFLWGILLRFFKIKSLALAFSLGYITIAVYSFLKGWRPLEAGGFAEHASEAVTLSWPAAMLVKYLKHNLYYLILLLSVLQYCVAGWIVEMIAGSVFREK
jgi:ABC-type branched-subunit amino acid transport system permease subunit